MPKPPTAYDQSGTQFAYGLNAAPGAPLNTELMAWRELLMRQELIGRDPLRYSGTGYGSLSTRLASTAPRKTSSAAATTRATSATSDGLFIISASQADHRDHNDPAAWTTIDTVNLKRFWAEARGTTPPSRHTMTHAAIYAAEPNAQFVFKVNCREIWRNAEALLLPATPARVASGSAAMIQAVVDLLAANMSRPLVFVCASETDSVFALGPTARDTGGLLISYLARALTLNAATPNAATPTAAGPEEPR